MAADRAPPPEQIVSVGGQAGPLLTASSTEIDRAWIPEADANFPEFPRPSPADFVTPTTGTPTLIGKT